MKDYLNKSITARTLLIIGLFLIVVITAGYGVSCQSQPAPVPPVQSPGLPPAPSPGEPPLPPSERWSADGVIDSQEYLGCDYFEEVG